jgi:signal transduction histidine kinase
MTRVVANMKDEEQPDPMALIGRLAVGAAHDINNYLAAGEVALTFAERAAGEEMKKDLRQVRASFDGVARIARALTAYARGGQPNAELIEIEPLVRRVLESFGRVIPEGVRVVVETASELPTVRGVASELEQVVLNLVLNACEAMIWGGTLWVIIERGPGAHLRLEVVDSGRGLPPEVKDSDGTTSPSSKHGRTRVGLGLGIVRQVVERHGGSVELGRAVGGGTSVVILLPT